MAGMAVNVPVSGVGGFPAHCATDEEAATGDCHGVYTTAAKIQRWSRITLNVSLDGSDGSRCSTSLCSKGDGGTAIVAFTERERHYIDARTDGWRSNGQLHRPHPIRGASKGGPTMAGMTVTYQYPVAGSPPHGANS